MRYSPCWECGYAVAKGIPVIAVRTDFRQSGDTQGFNAMLFYSAFAVIKNSDTLLEDIISAMQLLEKS